MRFHNLIMEILQIFSQSEVVISSEMQVLKSDIIKSCLLVLIYFILDNQKHQEIILQDKKYGLIITSLFMLDSVNFPLIFIFIE